MRKQVTPRATFLRNGEGNVAISAALVAPLIIGALALGVDYGNLTLQQRALQQAADLAAISAAAQLGTPEAAVAAYFRANNISIPVLQGDHLLLDGGAVVTTPDSVPEEVAKVSVGRYSPDVALPVAERFQVTESRSDAVKVEVTRKADLYFASAFAKAPVLSARAVAAADKMAAFSVGSRLASLHGGVLNALLTGLLGTSVDLDLMDYEALVDARIDALKTVDALATDLDLTAGSYQDVLDTNVKLGALIDAIGRNPGLSSRLNTVLDRLAAAVGHTALTVNLNEVLALGPVASLPVGTAENLAVGVNAFDLLTAAAVAANGNSQLAVDLKQSVPGLATATLKLTIGEPPVGTPPLAVGDPGTVVRTAQTRLSLEVTGDGLLALAGTKLRVPLYLEVAHAEARLANISCRSDGNADVGIEAVPGLVELALGNVDPTAFANFGVKPRVTKATLLDTALIDIAAKGYVNVTNLYKKSLTFTPSDIAGSVTKSVSTAQTLTSLQRSLLENLELDIRVGALTLTTPQSLQAALAQTLSALTVPLDTILYNTLLTLGVKVGEADVSVSYASCRRPVLVQ
ncbi:pilus assembly protein TadG-related protein [Ciceribacter ferrooxidans]|uniref:pilus assembly protein TadG-related protein n=1 Tax=Ciceribacter ferrooxidans TaxID=2509717 RepID=UPI001FDFA7FC|nr:pilus assembly protein TadG-related protein [Ciceribacter ferrooxidans]